MINLSCQDLENQPFPPSFLQLVLRKCHFAPFLMFPDYFRVVFFPLRSESFSS